LAEGVAFIADKLKNTNVLVHCVAGTNRSAVFVMAFLMKHMGLTLE
jgi:atypical dual specificity phosphatase